MPDTLMPDTPMPDTLAPSAALPACAHPASPGARRFRMQVRGAPRLDCWRCAARNRRMLRRSLLTGAVVGTILTAINQGHIIFDGEWSLDLAWRIPLTYCVPFLVASWGALGNAYVRNAYVRSAAPSDPPADR